MSATTSRARGGQRLTTDQWISRARAVHGQKYDYSLVQYVDFRTKVTIICAEHGQFMQRPANHVSAQQGCRKCAGRGSPTTEEWIARAREVHGERFSYEAAVYVSNRTPVRIRCPEHGEFEQNPKNHIVQRHGCPRCIGRGLTARQWIAKARAVHGGKYDYSLASFTNIGSPVTILCAEHGPFVQVASVHVKDRCGCPKCFGHKLTSAEWVERARAVHGEVYGYARFVYAGPTGKCEVICRQHGSFWVTPSNHIHRQSGCPLCSGSKGERMVSRVLEGLGVRFEPQWSHPTCRDKALLRFDFHLPDHSALIEFDGSQHSAPVKWFAQGTDEEAEAQFQLTLRHDRLKNEWAAKSGRRMLRVSDLKTTASAVEQFVADLRAEDSELETASGCAAIEMPAHGGTSGFPRNPTTTRLRVMSTEVSNECGQ